MTSFTLHPLRPDHAATVACLIRTAFATQSVVTDPPPSALRVTAQDVEAHVRVGGGGAVALADGVLVGSVLWIAQGDGLYLARLAVAPACRGQGIAKALVAATESAARGMGLNRVHLSTRLALLDNRHLFAACGFVETSREAHPGYAQPTFVNMAKRVDAAA